MRRLATCLTNEQRKSCVGRWRRTPVRSGACQAGKADMRRAGGKSRQAISAFE